MDLRDRRPSVLLTLFAVMAMTLSGFVAMTASPATTAAAAAPHSPPAVLPTATTVLPAHDQPVSDVPAAWTPHVHNGTVLTIAQVGSTVVVGGNFSEVSQSANSTPFTRTSIFAFDANTGQISTSFNPTVSNGQVMALLPGPMPGTVYAAGSFSGINGGNRRVVLLDVATGQSVPGFNAPSINSMVRDLALAGDRLLIGGSFRTVDGQDHAGLASLDASTGDYDPFLSVQLSENHNYVGQPNGAQAPVGARAMVTDPAGTMLAVVGNFRKADGLDRRQMVVIDLTGDTAQVRPDWRTRRFEAACAWTAFDTYMRDIGISPDGTQLAVATTGAANPGTLCDTVSLWDLSDSGDAVQPLWHDESGGDTLLSAASSGPVVYAGGHQRWQNNSGGRDYAAPGSVPRAGLAGFHTDWGLPIAWNPGRNPRGVGAEALLVTDAGLWVGSDTVWIGDRDYRRSRLAFFPVDGGQPLPPGAAGALPSNVYLGGSVNTAPAGDVLFRVNAGGPALPALDGGPQWLADSGTTSPWRTAGSNVAPYDLIGSVSGTVPSTTPAEIFSQERWDPDTAPEMKWSIPVEAGEDLIVRLYFANRYDGTSTIGSRVFDVTIDGAEVLRNYDIVAATGHNIGTMEAIEITSDGVVDIEFLHVVENPLINAIEIVRQAETDEPEPVPPLTRAWYEGGAVTAELEAAPDGGIDWSSVRSATVIDDVLYYISGVNVLKRTFDGVDYGPEIIVDPYNDPEWADVYTSSGGHYYRGVVPSFYGQLSSIRGMTFEDGLLYYTRAGMNQIFYRKFAPGGDVMAQAVGTVPGFNQASLGEIFLDTDGGYLYFTSTSTGTLSRIAWDSGTVNGSPQIVSGPGVDDVDWRAAAVFLADGPAPRVNQPPVADFTVECLRLVCAVDASDSSDEDGEVVEYAWSFGEEGIAEGSTAEYAFPSPGTYTINLVVTDDEGATGSAERTVEVVENAPPVAVVDGSCVLLECSFTGSGSSDADGSIVGYSWDFGDGSAVVEGVDVDHVYAEPGSYEVTLVVTDDSGATAESMLSLEVSDEAAAPAPELVTSAARNIHGSMSTLTLPSGIEAGDVVLLFVTSGNVDPLPEPGGVGPWTLVEETINGQLAVRVLARVADGTESGSTVSLTWPVTRKTNLTALVYRGAEVDGLLVADDVATGALSHTSPLVTAGAGNFAAVSFWADRGSNALEWTAPAEVEIVSSLVGTGGGRTSTLVGVDELTGPGSYGGLVATTSDTANRAGYITLLLPGQ